MAVMPSLAHSGPRHMASHLRQSDKRRKRGNQIFSKITKSVLAKATVDARELHHGPGEAVPVDARELHHGPGEDSHLLYQIINKVGSLEKIVNVVAILSRLRGRVGVKFKDEKLTNSTPKQNCDSNPVTALEHNDALKFLISHVQEGLDLSKYKGFNVEVTESALGSCKTVKLVILKSRVA